MTNNSDPNQSPDARARSIVRAYLAEGGELSADAIGALLDGHPELAAELRRALEVAQLTRRAQQRAAAAPTEHSRDSNNSSLSELLLDEAGWELAGYTIGERIGGGKYGEVFEAVSTETGQRVAIKCLRREYREHPQALERFRMEAEALSRLDHPGIVRVLDVRTSDTVPCIVMERVTGHDLHRSTRSSPLDPSRAASIIAEAADACHAAHERGILHRDIKPENILLDESGHPRLSDFGLAKLLDRDVELTGEEQALGTPHYMPPEQYDRRLGPTTHHADVYALGGTLYYLLTGRPPFPIGDGVGRETTLHQIGWARPRSLADGNEQVPADLALICLMCLEKRPHDRYADAEALADDLRRFLGGRPIRARLPGPAGRSWRWCARRPVMAAMLAVLLLTLTAGSFAAFYFAQEADTQRELTADARTAEADATSRRVFREHFADMRDAQLALDSGRTDEAVRILKKHENPQADLDPRGFEWAFLSRLANAPSAIECASEGTAWSQVRISPTSNVLACIDTAGSLAVLDPHECLVRFSLEGPFVDMRFTPDGASLVLISAGHSSSVLIVKTEDGSIAREIDLGLSVTAMSVSPDGLSCFLGGTANELLLVNLSSKRVTDLAAGLRDALRTGTDIQHGVVMSTAFSPDGKRVAVGYENGVTQVWSLGSKRVVARGPIQTGPVMGLSFDSEGSRIASQSFGRYDNRSLSNLPGELLVWNAEDGSRITSARPHAAMPQYAPVSYSAATFGRHYGQMQPEFLPEMDRVVTTGDREVVVWNGTTGERVGSYPGHGAAMIAVDFSPDGQLVAGVEQSGVVHLWPFTTNGPARTIFEAAAGIRALQRDGGKLVLLCEYGIERTDGLRGTHFSRSERRVISSLSIGSGEIEDIADGQNGAETLAVTPYGVIHDGVVLVPRSESLASEPPGGMPELSHNDVIASTANGRLLAIGRRDGTVRVVDAVSGQELWSAALHDGPVTSLAFSASGDRLASGGQDRRVRVVGSGDGSVQTELRGHTREVSGVAFSPDDSRLASSSGLLGTADMSPGEVHVWHLATEQLSLKLQAARDEIYCGVAWSGDGSRLFAAANPQSDADGRVEPGRIIEWSTVGAVGVP